MIYAYRTEKGRRSRNEDRCRIPDEGERPLVIVADGMGGHQAGNYASSKAVEVIADYVAQAPTELGVVPMLRQAIASANRSIFEHSRMDDTLAGMGTTVVLALLEPMKYTVAHIGDSRLYQYRADSRKLYRITKDHSYVQELVMAGYISEEQALTHPQRNILTRAVGTSGFEKADISTRSWRIGDKLLLCSDGLCGYVTDQAIERVLRTTEDALDCCDALTELALESGSTDNITIVIAQNAEVRSDGR